MRSTALSQDDLENRAISLLEEWGRYQRNEPPPLSSSLHPIYRAMEEQGRRSKEDRSSIMARRRNRHKVEINGKRIASIPMSPDRADKSSRGGAKTPERWPEHVERVDTVLAELPRPVLHALANRYIYEASTRVGASYCRVSHHEYRRLLERGAWYLIGKLDVIDA